jgi:hypothetical protein
MGLLSCLDRPDLIRFCLLTLPCKLMVGTSFSFLRSVCLETNAIDSETIESCCKPLRTVGSCRKTPWGSRILLQFTKGRSDLAAKPLMDGQIFIATCQFLFFLLFYIYIYIYIFYEPWV